MTGARVVVSAEERKVQVLFKVDSTSGVNDIRCYVRWRDRELVGKPKERPIPVFAEEEDTETDTYRFPDRLRLFRGRVRRSKEQAANAA